MESDHWFVTKMLDAELYGSNTSKGNLFEMQGAVWQSRFQGGFHSSQNDAFCWCFRDARRGETTGIRLVQL